MTECRNLGARFPPRKGQELGIVFISLREVVCNLYCRSFRLVIRVLWTSMVDFAVTLLTCLQLGTFLLVMIRREVMEELLPILRKEKVPELWCACIYFRTSMLGTLLLSLRIRPINASPTTV